MLLWMAVSIGTLWSAYSTTAELVAQVGCLRETLFICGNTWLIQSVI
jgi:hypothetical protein